MNSSVEERYFSSSEAIVSVISTTVYCRKVLAGNDVQMRWPRRKQRRYRKSRKSGNSRNAVC